MGMRFKIFFLLLFAMMPTASLPATVVKFGVTLCEAGQQMSSGKCVDITQAKCPSGYYETTINSRTYAAPSLELHSCMNSYDDTILSDSLYPIYNGVVVSFGVSLCDGNEQVGSGTCQERVRGRCEEGFYQTLVNGNTFSAPSAELNECMNSYMQYELPDVMSAIYNGIVVNFGPTLCGVGQYLSDGVCVSRERGDCPENFVDVTVSDSTMGPAPDAQCATGYKPFWLTANCATNQTQSGMCATLCDVGDVYTGMGVCAAMCSVNAGRQVTLNSLGGISLPLYRTRLTTPSLGVATSDGGVCYGNLVPGVQSGAINVTVSGNNYHITD